MSNKQMGTCPCPVFHPTSLSFVCSLQGAHPGLGAVGAGRAGPGTSCSSFCSKAGKSQIISSVVLTPAHHWAMEIISLFLPEFWSTFFSICFTSKDEQVSVPWELLNAQRKGSKGQQDCARQPLDVEAQYRFFYIIRKQAACAGFIF